MLRPLLAQLITSKMLRRTRERIHDLGGALSAHGTRLECFLGIDDPHSFLLAALMARHFAEQPVRLHLVRSCATAFDPDPKRRRHWALRDAHDIASYYSVEFPKLENTPSADQFQRFGGVLAALISSKDPWPVIAEAGHAFWHGDHLRLAALARKFGCADMDRVNQWLDDGTARLHALGHYQPAMIYYRGVWYWGVDRLWHLQKRLTGVAPPIPWPRQVADPAISSAPVIDLFFSARSPYSYLALRRLTHLHRRGLIKVNPRPVLPMVMRGLAVPARKRFYIIGDAAREAERYGIRFGRIADPLGKPLERAYALVDYARGEGRLLQYLDRLMRAVWSEGMDVGSDRRLCKIVEESGLQWTRARRLIQGSEWRQWAEENRQAMYALGLWGVPSMHDGRRAVWGQDRLFLLGVGDR